jgi:exodeoxyribonuclease-3
MKIASWNVNSIKARLPNVLAWLRQEAPDIACLQEIKCLDENFPALEIEDLGYNIALHGQKTYNGVAILSRLPFDEINRGLEGEEDDHQARYVEACVSTAGGALRVASIYLPNGNPAPGEKYDYKLAWMKRLARHVKKLLEYEEMLVLAGDYNVIIGDEDAFEPEIWRGDALFRPETARHFAEIVNLGLTNAVKSCHPQGHVYSYWDYKGGAWQKDNGVLIDHLLLSPQAADRLACAGVDRFTRGWEKPSDHAPVWLELASPNYS